MNYRELCNKLAEKIDLLDQQYRETKESLMLLEKDERRLHRLSMENLRTIMAEVRSTLGTQPDGMLAYFEALDEENDAPVSRVKAVIRRSMQEIDKLKAELPTIDPMDVLEENLEGLNIKLQALEESYMKSMDVMRLCNMDPVLLDYANQFANSWGNPGETLYENLRTEGTLRKTVRHFFGGGNKQASRFFDLYRNREGKVSGLAQKLDIRNADPLALRTKHERITKKTKKLNNQIQDTYANITAIKAKMHKRQSAEQALDEDACAERIFRELEKAATISDQIYLGLGDIAKQDVRVDTDTDKTKSWSYSVIWELEARLAGVRTLQDHKKNLLSTIDKTVTPLKRAKSKIHSKMHKVGHKTVTRFDWENPEKSINQLIGQATLSNDWYQRNRDALNSGQYGGFGDNILLWTAVYLTFSGDSHAEDFGPEVMEATESFKSTLQADVAQIGDIGLTENLESIDGSMSVLDTLPNSVSGLGGLDSIGSSLDSSVSSMTSSIDSSVSSSSFDSGGFTGGF